jgi:hypothetical protein
MTTLPPMGPLATAGAPIASTIVVIDVPVIAAAAIALGVLTTVLCIGALRARRVRRRIRAESATPALQGAVPYAALGGGR